jgi:hypothetical protein
MFHRQLFSNTGIFSVFYAANGKTFDAMIGGRVERTECVY